MWETWLGKKTITNENKTPRQIVVPWTKSKQYLKNNNNNQTKKQKQKKTKNQILGNGINHAHDKSVFVNYAFLSSSTSWKSPKIPQTCHIQSTIPPPPHTHTPPLTPSVSSRVQVLKQELRPLTVVSTICFYPFRLHILSVPLSGLTLSLFSFLPTSCSLSGSHTILELTTIFLPQFPQC